LSLTLREVSKDLHLATLAGEIDLSSSSVLARQLERLPNGSPQRIVVDLSGLTFIDSSGLNGLVLAARLVEARGGSVTFAGAPPTVDRLFAMVQLGKTVQLEDSTDDALTRARQELLEVH
jgi:stage II sporulation protein AA (anti-sigma F factor antagonist)